jgi:hypothetical protein
MMDHERIRSLAAAEIHPGLSPAEAAELEAHLASCPICRELLAAMRQDDARLRAALVDAPVAPRVRRRVLDEADGRGRRDPRLVVVLAATLVLTIVIGGALIGASLSTTRPPDETVVPSPPAPPSTSPSPLPSPSPSPSPIPSTARGPFVNGAYSYSVKPGATRRDSISAHLEDGPVGEWSRMNPATGGGTSFGGPVTCLVIDGPDAWLAGPATTTSDGSADRSAFAHLHDGGPGGEEDAAVLWMNDPGQTLETMEGWCESRFVPAGPYPLDDGDIVVEGSLE